MSHLLCKSVKISAVDDITVQKLHLKIHCIFIHQTAGNRKRMQAKRVYS